jgi:hypothetical protein
MAGERSIPMSKLRYALVVVAASGLVAFSVLRAFPAPGGDPKLPVVKVRVSMLMTEDGTDVGLEYANAKGTVWVLKDGEHAVALPK